MVRQPREGSTGFLCTEDFQCPVPTPGRRHWASRGDWGWAREGERVLTRHKIKWARGVALFQGQSRLIGPSLLTILPRTKPGQQSKNDSSTKPSPLQPRILPVAGLWVPKKPVFISLILMKISIQKSRAGLGTLSKDLVDRLPSSLQ